MSAYQSAAAAPREPASWRDTGIVRLLGALLSWFLFTLSFTLLYNVAATVSSLGGYCASGGPYVIAVECPDNVAAFAPLSIFGMMAAAGIGLFLSRGFGLPLIGWGWTILFVGLGWSFLMSFFLFGDLTGIVIGVLFVVMGIVPLVFAFRTSWRTLLIGTRTIGGREYTRANTRTTSMMPIGSGEGTAEPGALDWALGILIPLLGAAGGWYCAMLLWGS